MFEERIDNLEESDTIVWRFHEKPSQSNTYNSNFIYSIISV